MLNFRPGAGPVVAADTKNAVSSVDDALLNGIRMCASIVEATKGSDLPVGESQKLFSNMTDGLQAVVRGRESIVSVVRQLTHIKGRSNFAPDNFGCPEGWSAKASVGASEPQPVS